MSVHMKYSCVCISCYPHIVICIMGRMYTYSIYIMGRMYILCITHYIHLTFTSAYDHIPTYVPTHTHTWLL